MPGLIKIGYTTKTIDERMQQLNTSGIPKPFILGACFLVENVEKCELKLHEIFDQFRVNKNREFFSINIYKAISKALPILKDHLITDISKNVDMTSDIHTSDLSSDLDDNDIYFMQMILHNSYEYGIPITTQSLAKDHNGFHAIKLENKLINLSKKGLIQQVQQRNDVLSSWKMTSIGIQFMIENKYVLQDLIDEEKRLGE